MAKRIKKPVVRPEQRKDWLKRYEGGESPPKIADSDGFDVRTVRTHIKLAMEEKEVKEAKAAVLRNALECHYADLYNFAEKLDAEIAGLHAVSFAERDELMRVSLKQHLPRSPIWRYLARWDYLHQRIIQLKGLVKPRLENAVKLDSKLSSLPSAMKMGVTEGIIVVLVSQVGQWYQGYNGLNLDANLISEPADEEGFVNLRYGYSQMGKVRIEQVAVIREVLADFESSIRDYEEYCDLAKSFSELKRLSLKLRDELAVIILRRIVPGRCKFCPL